MYDYISGNIVELTPAEMVVDNHGIGYKILISLQTYSALQGATEGKIYIYHHKHEDDELFYGFADKEERAIFTLLVSVSGIGPNTARMMLSALTTDEVRMALISGDVNKIKSVKGIGLKTAQRAIIELKDKVGKEGVSATIDLGTGFESNSHREEAYGALITLGFTKAAVEKVLNTILKKEPLCTSEEIIKKALKLL
ncbi:MAG: Holliday junction branch migration protein RuvA [Bacteroidales bacterium]|nr:Holliday junction branch migration protein RuvA [Bacteroidales bacterium]